jgi:UTP:GlnB (protein PII) uridylyltransferase
MYKAICKLDQPVNADLMTAVSRIDAKHRRELQFLSGALDFYKNLRNSYRLAVGAEDRLRPEHLPIVATAMGLGYGDEEQAEERLLRAYRGCTTQVGEIVDSIAEDLVLVGTDACAEP